MKHDKVVKINPNKPQVSKSALEKAKKQGYGLHSLPDFFTDNDPEILELFAGSTIVDFRMLPTEEIKEKLKLFQHRKKTFCPKHAQKIEDDLRTRGRLLEPLVVLYYKGEPVITNGHHRFPGLKNLGYEKIPCFVIEFENKKDRLHFLHKAQDVPPAMSNKEADANLYLNDLDILDEFKGMTEAETKARAKELLKKVYSSFSNHKIGSIVRYWDKNGSDGLKFQTKKNSQWQTAIKKEVQVSGKSIEFGKINNGEYHIFHQENGISQCLGQIFDSFIDEELKLKGTGQSDKEVLKTLNKIKIIVHCALLNPTDKLQTKREEVNQRWKFYNQSELHGFSVSTIVWRSQKLLPLEELIQIYNWDNNKKEFIKESK